MTIQVTLLTAHHNRVGFDCGEPALNEFLRRLARQQAKRGFNRTYVAVENEGIVPASRHDPPSE